MVKDDETVIKYAHIQIPFLRLLTSNREFNELVNMTSSELETWLKTEESSSSGWQKANEDGETIGHESGRKIVEILKKNPKKEAEKYDEG